MHVRLFKAEESSCQTQKSLSGLSGLLEASLGNMIEEDSTPFIQFLWEGRSLVYFVQSQLATQMVPPTTKRG